VGTPKRLRRVSRRFRAFWLAHIWLAFVTIAVGVAGIIAVAAVAPRQPDPDNPGEQTIYGWYVLLLVLMIVLIAGGIVSIVSKYSRESRPERIQRLSSALREAESIIASINRDMEEGAERLAELEARTAMHEELADLSSEKAAAIRGAIAAELGVERRRGLWRDSLFTLLGALLGAGFTFLLERLV
jgi:hypothetical protein